MRHEPGRARWWVVGALLAVAGARAGGQAAPAIRYEKYALPNGLEVILHQDHSTPIVAVSLWYHVGSGDERAGRTGLAHLFEHVMFMGSRNVPVGKLDTWMESAGGSVNGGTTPDWTEYTTWMPSNALPLALWLESDRMGFLLPTMDQAKLDLQRDVVRNERRQKVDNAPYGRAEETILAALFGRGHPYSWDVVGSMDDLGAASLADVQAFFRTYYAPNNATLTIAGDFDPDSARKLVATYFGRFPRGPAVPPRQQAAAVALARDTFVVAEDKVQLPRLYNAWHTVKLYHGDEAALDLLASVLGAGRSSRLYQRLVHEAQVAQDVTAFQLSGRLDGQFRVVVTPRPGQTPAAVQKLVDAELARVAADGVTERELTRARNTLRAQALDRVASVRGKAGQLNYYNAFAGTPDFFRRDAERYAAATADDVKRVAAAYLARRPRVVLTIVPEGKRDMMVTAGAQ